MSDIRDQLVDEIVALMEHTFDDFTREHGHAPHVLKMNPLLHRMLMEQMFNLNKPHFITRIEELSWPTCTAWMHRYTGVPMRFDVDANVDAIMAMEV